MFSIKISKPEIRIATNFHDKRKKYSTDVWQQSTEVKLKMQNNKLDKILQKFWNRFKNLKIKLDYNKFEKSFPAFKKNS